MSFGDEVAEKMAGLGEGVYKAPEREREPSPGGDSWYLQGGIEPADFILSNDLPAYKGLAIKYIFRAGWKQPEGHALASAAGEIEDIKKAIYWLTKRLKQLEGA
jgi:hypothetical protein